MILNLPNKDLKNYENVLNYGSEFNINVWAMSSLKAVWAIKNAIAKPRDWTREKKKKRKSGNS